MSVIVENKAYVEHLRERRAELFQLLKQAHCPGVTNNVLLNRLAAIWEMDGKCVFNLHQGRFSLAAEDLDSIRSALEAVVEPPPGLIESIDLSLLLTLSPEEREEVDQEAARARQAASAPISPPLPLLPHILVRTGDAPDNITTLPVGNAQRIRVDCSGDDQTVISISRIG